MGFKDKMMLKFIMPLERVYKDTTL